ncbi:NADH-quinone oxidoreductase subunit M [Kitasatospora aureofaciens]|uniref:NADH-quinone oxidoreductase subunit M n=1 Tax=Kitasatospora aureofaciens TaxID=1894 RepID=A0A1E7NA20_KITAU|nr:NADH-quinone oxidoreductase subunit M [Kitasatospora aureofaciens]ARF79034.1 NADH-quinone oxidoreductase subunit M [Kitasatospora aureofaciens]OEV37536.1 NADH-quinone oxidoreductase subunit M [Kitasatospora aureofaciens]GGU83328.1 NADH-quinone oxidoreductase subunit M [Kitasatospora aureofaciens]HJD83400.1 NADH-quinone oxidoreductase subunit M [Kitasatospora aureofaciens]
MSVLLTTTCAVPAAGAVLTAALPAGATEARRRTTKTVALAVSAVTLALAAAVALRFDPHGARYQLTESYSWIRSFGITFSLGVDGIGAVLALLTAVLVPMVMLASWHDADPGPAAPDGTLDPGTFERRRRTQGFFALILAVEAMVIVSFYATDVFLFYVFFEAMLIPMYFLIGGFGDRAGGPESARQRSYAAVKFLLYNLLGGLVMLAAVIGLYVIAQDQGFGTFDLPTLTDAVAGGSLKLSGTAQNALFLGFFFAFAVKAPLWPLHTWLPNAMGEATAGTAVLITAVVDKVGTFAMLRFCLGLFPDASKTFAPAILVLSLIGIVYGALLAIGQKDIKRLVAYASISHFGFIIMGIFALTSQGQSGATLYMVNHGLSTAAWMLVAGFLISRRGSRLIADYGGVQKVAPVLAGTFLIGSLATLSLPGLAPFVSEFLVLVGTFTRYPAIGVIATVGIVLAALYALLLYQRTMTGPVKEGVRSMPDLKVRELAVVAPLVALTILLGVYPRPLTDLVNPSVDATLSQVHRTDPAPAHPVAATSGGEQK